jgi:MoxR-like ATPase
MDDVFLNALLEQFPDVKTSGSVSRKQIADVMEKLGESKWPTWIMKEKNRVGRGEYQVPGLNSATVQNVIPMVKHESTPTSVVQNTSKMVPSVDKSFVPFGIYKDVDVIVKSKQFYPVYIYGPTGNGKSTAVEQSCAKNKTAMIRVNLNMMTDEDQLIGSKTLVDGNIEIIEGPVLIAMRTGIPLLLDELDGGSANTLLCLQPILEGKPYYFKLKNEVIVPATGFNVFATGNTKGKGSDDGRYIGTNILNEAFLERFAVTLCQDYPNATTEKKIVHNLMHTYNCFDEEFASSLVKWADAIRRTFADGGIDETITTRRLIHIVRAFSIFKNKTKAIELCTNRFDDVTKTAFINLFEKVSADPTPVETETKVETDTFDDIPF